ncbi:RHS repeat-associated core domain-containing protein, partial [Wenjunlia vitaminophila]|uniref:RHS repeat-associated core domain-containing protein n=1 Tax=Wenjunlia vitaminophila TaxID=76728 RepID=UPI000A983B51
PRPPQPHRVRTHTGTRITQAGHTHYHHDPAGRTTQRRTTRLSKKPDTWHYTWNTQDHLTDVVTPDGTQWHYTYDPLGRRTTKQRLTHHGTIAEETVFTWDGTTLTEQTTTHTAPNTTPTPDPAPDPLAVTLTWEHHGLHPLTQTERITDTTHHHTTDQRFYAIITDLVGTPTELITPNGTITWRTRTTLWGTTTWNRNATAHTPLRFPGQYHDPETGLHYNHHRYYNPTTAHYLTPDPLGLTPAPNPVTYVENPHTRTDHLGLAPDCGETSKRTTGALADPGPTSGGARAIPGHRADGTTVIHGHGSYRGGGTFVVPEGTAIHMYVLDGQRLDAARGLRIAGPGGPGVAPVEVFTAGDTIPNYTLSPLGTNPHTGLPMVYREGSIVVDERTLLGDILKPNMGVCHWVACRYPGYGNG